MKKLLIILCLLSSQAMAGEYEFKNCIKVYSYTKRCENKEVVCYMYSRKPFSTLDWTGGGISCFKK